MCYFLYGGVNDGANCEDLKEVESMNFHFQPISHKGIKKGINSDEGQYHINRSSCACGTAVGKHDYDAPELQELAEYIKNLQYVRDIEWVYICKKWWDDKIKDQQTVHIDDIDLVSFLADIQERCLYKIELFQRC